MKKKSECKSFSFPFMKRKDETFSLRCRSRVPDSKVSFTNGLRAPPWRRWWEVDAPFLHQANFVRPISVVICCLLFLFHVSPPGQSDLLRLWPPCSDISSSTAGGGLSSSFLPPFSFCLRVQELSQASRHFLLVFYYVSPFCVAVAAMAAMVHSEEGVFCPL